MSLFQYTRCGSTIESATPQEFHGSCDLITVLAVAQELLIELLPISWDEKLDVVGHGATAEIREAIISKAFSYIFKRPARHLRCDSEEVERRYLPMLIDEITILGNPEIRRHPNIIQIEGICWEILAEDSNRLSRQDPVDLNTRATGIMPVLVFQKSKLGDLDYFMTQGEGQALDIVDRIKICIDIAKGVAKMHSQNIVHGDIKPQNVLVFAHDTEGFVARVADFGFSTQWVGSNDKILMPRSKPWAAPEWHHRGFLPAQAKRMDTYSFGMLVLWVIWLTTRARQERYSQYFEPGCETNLDVAGLIPPLVKSVLHDQKLNLEPYFTATFSKNPESRCSDFEHLQMLLSPKKDSQSSLSGSLMRDTNLLSDFPNARPKKISERVESKNDSREKQFAGKVSWKTANFQLIPAMRQLYRADHRVRVYVARCLLRKLAIQEKDDVSGQPLQNTLLQCAICFETGFGIERNSRKSRDFLGKCGDETTMMFHRDLSVLKQGQYPEGKPAWAENRNREKLDFAISVKYTAGNGLFESTLGQTELDDFVQELRNEIADTERGIGSRHDYVRELKASLSIVLADSERLEEAKIFRSEVEDIVAMEPAYHRFQPLAIKDNLALITLLLRKRRSKERDGIFLSQLGALSPKNFGHDATMIAFNTSSSTLAELPPLKTEEYLSTQAFEDFAERLNLKDLSAQDLEHLGIAYQIMDRFNAKIRKLRTDGYPKLRKNLGSYCTALMLRKNWAGAEALQTEIVRQNIEFLGIESLTTFNSTRRLAAIFSNSGQLHKSQTLHTYLLKLSEQLFGKEHSKTLEMFFALTSVYQMQQDIVNSLKLIAGKRQPSMAVEASHQEMTEMSNTILGANHYLSLRSKGSWAMVLFDQNRFKQAERLQEEILETSKMVLGETHENTLDCTLVLSVIKRKRGRWKEAKELTVKAFEGQSSVYRVLWQLGVYLTLI